MNCYKKIMIDEMLKLDITSLASGGRGVARTGKGQAVFISGAIPGERICARVVKVHASYLEADVEEIMNISPERVEPACKKYESCGGCDWQHMRYSEQVRWKDAILMNHLRKSISEKDTQCMPPVSSPMEYEYRSHVRLRFEGSSAGFYMKNTNRIVEIDDCPIADRRIREVLPSLKKHISSTAFRNKSGSLELFSFGGRLKLVIHLSKKASAVTENEVSRMCDAMNISGAVIIDGNSHSRMILGNGGFAYHVHAAGKRFMIKGGLGGFVQSNPYINSMIVEYAVGLMSGADNVLDFYCGCGNFTIPLASTCGAVTGIDHDRRLTGYVLDNASMNGLGNVSVMTSDIEGMSKPLAVPAGEYDAILMDPPRTGASNLVKIISKIKPGKIVYVSCEPSTMARDLNVLRNSGYILGSVRMFDMFPQTHHIEAVACLMR